jgi:hypothetical protein
VFDSNDAEFGKSPILPPGFQIDGGIPNESGLIKSGDRLKIFILFNNFSCLIIPREHHFRTNLNAHSELFSFMDDWMPLSHQREVMMPAG